MGKRRFFFFAILVLAIFIVKPVMAEENNSIREYGSFYRVAFNLSMTSLLLAKLEFEVSLLHLMFMAAKAESEGDYIEAERLTEKFEKDLMRGNRIFLNLTRKMEGIRKDYNLSVAE
jgi:hypothetical protein